MGADGALNVDDSNAGDFKNAKVDLTNVFGQAGIDGVTDGIIDELSLELGAIGSTSEAEGSTYTSEYVVSDES